jgi:DNA-binding MarR family transcriptional regulator
MVDENELKVIEEIAQRRDLTQRELSAKTKLSLGAVNLILKRLVRRGIVRTTILTPKKIEYFLTPKGFVEKTKKSYNYVLKTIELVKTVKTEIAKIVMEEYSNGQQNFVVLGSDDLADIIELALKGFAYQRVNSVEEIKDKNTLVLVGRLKLPTNGFRAINVADKLGEAYWPVELGDQGY